MTAPQPSSTSTGWTDAFLEMMAVERAAAKNTLTAYGKDLAEAGGFLAKRGSGLATATSEEIEAYFADLGARGMAAATAARRRAAVRQFYRFVVGEGWRTDDPSRRVGCAQAGPSPAQAPVAGRGGAADRRGAGRRRAGRPAHRLHGGAALRLGPAGVGAGGPAPVGGGARDPAFIIVKGKGGKERLRAPQRPGADGAEGLYRDSPGLPAQGRQGEPGALSLSRRRRAAQRPAVRADAGRRGADGRDRSRQGEPARASPRLRHPPAGRGARICAPCRPCSATWISPPPRSTPTWRPTG